MYLEKSQKNKYSIGKVFRKTKGLRMSDPNGKVVPMPPQLQQYYDQLIAKGVQVKSLTYAMFETSNGLKYPGLIATQKILSNTVLVKVPVEAILTTRDAFLSDVQKIFVENPGYYAKRFTSEWEDRINLTFLLYQYQKGKKSKWYNLIRNLPKDIDYAIFWNKDEIDFLQDEYLKQHIQMEKQRFQKDCTELIRILKNYPQFFEPHIITKQNIQWIHTHLVTRCFGKYFQYTTMVPFAQLFNHECIDVYYTMYYKPGNPHDQKQQFYQQKQLTETQMDQCDSSDGSYDAEDFQQKNQFIQLSQLQTWDINQQQYGVQIIKDIVSIFQHMFTFINFSDSISLHYLSLIIRQLASTSKIQSFQGRKKKCQQIHGVNVVYIRKVKQFYKTIKRKYYTYAITQRQKPKQPKPEDKPQQGVSYFEKQWPKDKFDQFYMLCSTKDQFQKGSQVFFCYGRLPNKLLLMRYGIALEHNKYDHMFVKISVEEEVLNDLLLRSMLEQIQIKRYQRFKVKRTKICVELITHFRMKKWVYGQDLDKIFVARNVDLQLQVLSETKQFYINYLSKYKKPLKVNQQNLKNKNLGYHEYFALVYKIEQQRILTQQIKMVDYAIFILQQLKKGQSLKDVLMKDKQPEILTRQIMMEKYFKMFDITNI